MNLQEALKIINKHPQILNDVMCQMYGDNHTKLFKLVAVEYDEEGQSLEKYFEIEGSTKLDHYSALATQEDIIKYAKIINSFLESL